MQFDNLKMLSWHDEMLPDFLWIALMLGRRSDWNAVYKPLDVVDRFVPDDHRVADGRLTSFALVPESARAAARDAIQREAPHAFPTAFGHALGLYPTCPALWLYADWLNGHEPDPGVGIPLLRTLVAENADKSGVRSTRLRMAAIARLVIHGKFVHTGGPVLDKVPKYPHLLGIEDQRAVESVMRATWATIFGIEVERDDSAVVWARDFWRRNRALTPCEVLTPDKEMPVSNEAEGPIDPEPMVDIAELRDLLVATRTLGDGLREAQLEVVIDPQNDSATSVLLGMASRMYRLLVDFLDRPSSWSPATAGFYLRPLVETRIVAAWLAKRNDLTLIDAYREHGLGNLKLLRDHIKADFGDHRDSEASDYLEYLDSRVNLEVDEWAQSVNVGTFSSTTIRQMAIECDLKRLYDLSFAPLSSENHGEWPAVRDVDTRVCAEGLHGGHRIGTFAASSHTIGPQAVHSALQIAEDGITATFEHFGIDVSAGFAAVWEAFNTAMYDEGDETGAASDEVAG